MSTTVTYLFDPLCGWCYGASPAIERLGQEASINLELAPTGLFSSGGRVMSADFAEYAWSNDVRIGKLTGQTFSAAYRSQVLGQHGTRFDSSAASLALTAVAQTAPAKELETLKVLQEARYSEGLDICTPQGVEAVLRSKGLTAAADLLTRQDADLQLKHDGRIQNARRLMQAHGAQGVPALVVHGASGARLVRGDALYNGHDGLMAAIAAAAA
ncbi:MAG: DsbA family protein [Curvibacter sp.]|nr:MAG: DsbA family protein [Curvibacter sp.]